MVNGVAVLVIKKNQAKKNSGKPAGGAKTYNQIIAEKKAAKKLAGQ